MKRRRLKRRLFNLFAFAFLAFAIYLIAFSKEDSRISVGHTAHASTGGKTLNNTH